MAWTGPTAAANVDAVLTDLVAFAVTNAGFTDEGSLAGSGSMTSDLYRLSKGGIYWAFRGYQYTKSGFGTIGRIEARVMHVLPTVANFTTMSAGQRNFSRSDLYGNYNGAFTGYYFFTDGVSVNMALEVNPNVFTHLSFGNVTKYGTWTGGEYVSGVYCDYFYSTTSEWRWGSSTGPYFSGGIETTNYEGAVRHIPGAAYGDYRDYAGVRSTQTDNQCARFVMPVNVTDPVSTLDQRSMIGRLLRDTPSTYNQRACLFPTYLRLWNPTLSLWHLAGHVDNVRVLNMELIDPKELVDVDWMVFPQIAKFGDISSNAVSGSLGVAYKRIP